MYFYNENYLFRLDETALAILCDEIKPILSENVFESIFYNKFL